MHNFTFLLPSLQGSTGEATLEALGGGGRVVPLRPGCRRPLVAVAVPLPPLSSEATLRPLWSQKVFRNLLN